MKLKCVSSLDMGTNNPAFIKGNEYEVMDMTNDGRYYVVTENGTYIDVTLKGAIWKFELIEDEILESKQEREDILFEIESLINQLNNEFNKLKKLI